VQEERKAVDHEDDAFIEISTTTTQTIENDETYEIIHLRTTRTLSKEVHAFLEYTANSTGEDTNMASGPRR
jgi:hypothetical protein